MDAAAAAAPAAAADKADTVGTEKADKRRNRRRKQITGPDVTVEDLRRDWQQCMFYMAKKQRLCNVERCQGSLYCGNHRPAEDGASNRALKVSKGKSIELERIPCPVDPTHTIYRHNLASHTAVCNVRKRQNAIEFLPYYSHDCNSGPPLDDAASALYCMEVGSAAAAEAAMAPPPPPVDPELLMGKVERCFARMEMELAATIAATQPPTTAPAATTATDGDDAPGYWVCDDASADGPDMAPEAYAALENHVVRALAGRQTAFDRVRHARQDARIVHQMIKHGLVRWQPNDAPADHASNSGTPAEGYHQEDTVFIELGAGKGLLGLAVACVKPRSYLVLVERAGLRRKVDKALREHQLNFYRARMDIRHVLISKLPGVDPLYQRFDGTAGEAEFEACHGDDPRVRPYKGTLSTIEKQMYILNAEAIARSTAAAATASTTSSSSSSSDVGPAGAGAASAAATSTSDAPAGDHKKVVIMAKHLCGAATDLALRSLNAFVAPSADDGAGGGAVLAARARGLAIATCCHHACNWRDYLGREWLAAQGVSPAEFDVMKIWSGWAHTLRTKFSRRKQGPAYEGATAPEGAEGTAPAADGDVDDDGKRRKNPFGEGGARKLKETKTDPPGAEAGGGGGVGEGGDVDEDAEDDDDDNGEEGGGHNVPLPGSVVRPAGITYEKMALAGKKVKRVLDYGRLLWLRDELGLDARMVRYCDTELSPECWLLVNQAREEE